ncbi:MAG: DUF87 domain-containing protein [Candidatus Hodarchaeaceae archaeon]|nr:DUF87 domain-containing protein [Candidatus Hodarchaeaceae archaeon]
MPEFQCVAYFISEITPKIAEESFKPMPKIKELLEERKRLEEALGGDEEKIKRGLELIKGVRTSDESLKLLEDSLKRKLETIQQIKKLDSKLETANSVLNEWIEKGYALCLLWNFSTTIHVCSKYAISAEIEKVLDEIEMIEKQSVRARAYQQELWIEEVKDPFHVYFAEAVGFTHPKILQTYDSLVMKKFAEEIEQWFNARLALPIQRAGFTEESSTAVAEALAAFLRQVKVVEAVPKKAEAKLSLEKIKKPVYFGYLQTKTPEGFESSNIPFMVDLDELRKHCLITGTTGSGKTRVAQLDS